MELALLIDIGSTYTKAFLFDLVNYQLIARSQAYTTVEQDVNRGLAKALAQLEGWEKAHYKLACSSAAGGLKIIAIGLVPDLTAEAAKRAALGAGSKVLKTYSYQLSTREIAEISQADCDIILLAGGTDGGDQSNIIHNARMLADSQLAQPIIMAGNKSAADQIITILKQADKEIYQTGNVMPELEELNIEPARKVIRDLFLKKIIEAKGLSRVKELVDGVIMPTPAAVLKAAELVATGYNSEKGWGELLIVDIGGATTDVHSVASGKPTKGGINWRGLTEPYLKRTVEGDLGMRYSALALCEAIGTDTLKEQLQGLGWEDSSGERYQQQLKSLCRQVDFIPGSKREKLIDALLGRNAARLAVARHVGKLKTIYTPMGPTYVQEGKDLTTIKYVIGTGGVIVNNHNPAFILEGLLYKNQHQPELLAPVAPELILDREYLLAAVGLLAGVEPAASLKIIKKYLAKIELEGFENDS